MINRARDDGTYQCRECENYKTDKDFSPSRIIRRDYVCRECAHRRMRERRKSKLDTRSMTDIVKLANQQRENVPDLNEYVNKSLDKYGGMDSFVDRMFGLIEKAASDKRTTVWQEYKIQEGFLNLWLKLQALQGKNDDLDKYDADELDKRLAMLVRKVADQEGGEPDVLGVYAEGEDAEQAAG